MLKRILNCVVFRLAMSKVTAVGHTRIDGSHILYFLQNESLPQTLPFVVCSFH